MIGEIFTVLMTAWPRFFFCAFWAVGLPFSLIVFDLKWWIKIIIGFFIFSGLIVLGIVLEVDHARTKKREEQARQNASKPPEVTESK